MIVQHGGLTIDVPQGWSDRSTLLFVGPPAGGAQLPTAHPVQQPGEAVAISFVTADGRKPGEILEEQSGPLRKSAEGFEVLEEGPVRSGLGHGLMQVQKLRLGDEPLRQVVAVFCVGALAVVATATAGEAGFAAARGRLVGMIESLGATGAPAQGDDVPGEGA